MRIDVTGLTKQYGKEVTALKEIHFSLGVGVTGLIGPNGAGKSSLMNLLVGLNRPTKGAVHIDGVELEHRRTAFYRRLGFLPQSFMPYPMLSVYEFLDYLAILKGLKQRQARCRRVEETLETVHLADVAGRKTGGLSGGMRQRLGIAQALLNDPEVLILDEPTAGLDPQERSHIRQLLAEMAFSRLVLVSSHIISDLSATAEKLLILEAGNLIFDGRVSELLQRAAGRIWEVEVEQRSLSNMLKGGGVINTRREGERVVVRLAGSQPSCPGARAVDAELEDAYVDLRERAGAQ